MKEITLGKLTIISCGTITRALRGVRGLKGKAYVVGGLVTEGQTLKDIDIIVDNLKDIPKLKKALGKYASRVHFMFQKKETSAPLFIKITGSEPKSPDLYKPKKGKSMPKNEYAGLC